jgi:hypothetical protein
MLLPHVPHMVAFVAKLDADPECSDAIVRECAGLLGDCVETFGEELLVGSAVGGVEVPVVDSQFATEVAQKATASDDEDTRDSGERLARLLLESQR